MFNAPRRMGGPPLSNSAFISSPGLSSSAYADPLASSAPNAGGFGEMDPWSAVPSPARSGTPRDSVEEIREGITAGATSSSGREGLNGLIMLVSDVCIRRRPPAIYVSLLDQLDTTGMGNVSLASVQRLLATSRLPALTVEKIVHLTSRDKSTLSRQEFFCALALVALAQSSNDDEVSIERLSASLTNLPLPDLRPSAATNASTLTAPPAGYSLTGPESPALAESPGTSTGYNAWDATPRTNGFSDSSIVPPTSGGYSANGSAFRSDGMVDESQQGYWKRLEVVEVDLVTEKEGWFLQKYRVNSSKRSEDAVSRRYSDFVWLLDCLVKRYPFRLLPSLPPKRIGPDASFLEARRKALRRFINFIVNHPVMKDDGALNVFLTEPNFEAWRKRTKVSSDEESLSKKLNPAQEMAIPSDLDEKLGRLRDHLPTILGSYQKMVILAERGLARLFAQMGDASRVSLSVQGIGETVGKSCFRCVTGGEACSLCEGVGRGLGEVGEAWTKVAEETEKRVAILTRHIEALKTQRDLYLAFRDLFLRHDRLSKDVVDSLRKKVESRSKKIEGLKAASKPGWKAEVDKLVAASDQDNATVTTLLSRRVFIKACMWHELSVVHHSRQAAQATLGWREFTKDQIEAYTRLAGVWEGLDGKLGSMPVE